MKRRVLAIASSGGHWQQLLAVRAAFADAEPLFVTTQAGMADHFDAKPNRLIRDCSRSSKVEIFVTGIQLLWILVKFRPHVIITTGALPGVMALAIGRVMRSKTIWIDSVANAEEMSMSGRAARRFADLWLSQWEEVAKENGAEYAGSIL